MANILIIDDSRSMRQLVLNTLKQSGHQVTEAENGKLGVEAADKGNFDLVITDINMPLMDGFEVTKALRAHAKYRSKPILVLTTDAGADSKAKGKSAGATGWIVKPFSPEQLAKTVQKVL